jgi:hypothetical protein
MGRRRRVAVRYRAGRHLDDMVRVLVNPAEGETDRWTCVARPPVRRQWLSPKRTLRTNPNAHIGSGTHTGAGGRQPTRPEHRQIYRCCVWPVAFPLLAVRRSGASETGPSTRRLPSGGCHLAFASAPTHMGFAGVTECGQARPCRPGHCRASDVAAPPDPLTPPQQRRHIAQQVHALGVDEPAGRTVHNRHFTY